MAKNNEQTQRRLQRKRDLKKLFIIEAMFENGYTVRDVLSNDLLCYAHLLKKRPH